MAGDSRAFQVEGQHVVRGDLLQPQPVRLHQEVTAIGGTGADVAEGVVPVAAHGQDAARPGHLLAQSGVSHGKSRVCIHRRSVGG